jgi:hypothetical protein
MSEHHFSVRSEVKLSEEQVAKLEEIADRHDATFIYMNTPGNRHKSWFSCRNLGEPFNRNTARAVAEDIERELPELAR